MLTAEPTIDAQLGPAWTDLRDRIRKFQNESDRWAVAWMDKSVQNEFDQETFAIDELLIQIAPDLFGEKPITDLRLSHSDEWIARDLAKWHRLEGLVMERFFSKGKQA